MSDKDDSQLTSCLLTFCCLLLATFLNKGLGLALIPFPYCADQLHLKTNSCFCSKFILMSHPYQAQQTILGSALSILNEVYALILYLLKDLSRKDKG